jgi:Flp pilus assembly protein TadB
VSGGVLALLGSVIGLLLAFALWAAREVGKAAERSKSEQAAREEATKRTEEARDAKERTATIHRLPDGAAAGRLREKWSRD